MSLLPLRFRPDGTFRVLMMSDIQESAQYDPRSLRSVEAQLDECQPDLVIWEAIIATATTSSEAVGCSSTERTTPPR